MTQYLVSWKGMGPEHVGTNGVTKSESRLQPLTIIGDVLAVAQRNPQTCTNANDNEAALWLAHRSLAWLLVIELKPGESCASCAIR